MISHFFLKKELFPFSSKLRKRWGEKTGGNEVSRKGEQLNLTAVPPVNVFLGDGTGVELTVNEQPYVFSQYINSKNIAKFEIQ